MTRSLVIVLAASLIFAPYTASVSAKGPPSGLPPIEQPLVSEGEFAVELATGLGLTASPEEEAAESTLASINIMPKNGWISDYPMTPDIIAEIRESTIKSARAGSLNISEADAAHAVDSVTTAMNLAVQFAGGNNNSSTASAEYMDPSRLEEYYADNGPPVVTYYSPPEDYAYLYDWVPSPFWWDGVGFGGFFVLVDFDRHHHHHRFTNHVWSANGKVSRINAVTRANTTAGAPGNGKSTLAGAQGSRFNSPGGQTGARSIMNHRTASGTVNGTGASVPSMHDMDRPESSGTVTRSPSMTGRTLSGAPSVHSFGGGMGGSFHGGGMGGGFHGGGMGGGFHGGGGHH